MDVSQSRAAPIPFTKEELEGARRLRIRLCDTLPEEFDSEFFLARWWRAYKGDEKALENKLNELIEHRRAFGYNENNIHEKCKNLEFARKTFERFGIAQLNIDHYSDNVAVFVQRMKNSDLKEITKVLPLSYVCHSYFLLHECFQKAIRQKELETGKPASVAVILDLEGLNLTDFLNPMSNPSKLARLVVKIWSEYFSENMTRLYLMHPPGILSIMWQVVKHIADEKTQSSIAFIQKVEDLQKCLDPAAIPVDLGGTWRDDSGFADPPESCCQKPLPVSAEDYFDRNLWWKSHGFTKKAPEPKTTTIKNKSIFEITKELKEGEKLCWEFTTNTDLTFDIVRVISKSDTPESLKENIGHTNGKMEEIDEETLSPKVTLTSLKVPEHGVIIAKHPGIYKFRWETSGGGWSLISNKLHYIVEICKQ
jgi:hypothetical protein